MNAMKEAQTQGIGDTEGIIKIWTVEVAFNAKRKEKFASTSV